MIRKKQMIKSSLYGRLVILMLGLFLVPDVKSTTTQGVIQLSLQEQLDKDVPFNHSQWVGTHNSYNAREWDSAYWADPNQDISIYDQLKSGVRELTLDVGDYGTFFGENQLRLCHGVCFGGEKKFRRGLESIVRWLEEGNAQSVILLKLEINSDHYGQIASQLRAELGSYLYEASFSGGGSNRCAGLPVDSLSKQNVLDSGKNIVVVNTDLICPQSGSFRSVVHLGLQYQGFYKDKFSKPTDPNTCELMTTSASKQMTRLHDPSTLYGIGSGGKGPQDKEITESNVKSYLSCGLNIFEMFWFNGDGSAGHLEPEDLLWSWESTEPNNWNGNEHCAISKANGRFNDVACSKSYRFACRDEGEWKITAADADWSQGEVACKYEYPGSVFDVPFNGYDNARLMSAKIGAGASTVWLAYHDLNQEGLWQKGVNKQ
ncbi:hypothetical protein [Microbulbifer sp. JMSA008]|uniref:hypothetical protein n=1 Tax=Microbulbifer sp. JMSA008 TaxID=3243373 RepID=UPI004039693D